MSSFGSPGGRQYIAKPIPPERGSFPLDHEGECAAGMAAYLKCLKREGGVNAAPCRDLAKSYLTCRMERGLMAPDEMRNLGFQDGDSTAVQDGRGKGKGT